MSTPSSSGTSASSASGTALRVGGGLVVMAVLYAVLGPLGLVLGGWLAFSPDPLAGTGRSGGGGALAAGGRAAGAHLASEWRRGAPGRAQRRTARRDRWWAAGDWRRRALAVEHALIVAWRTIRTIAPALWPAGRRGTHAMPGGWRRGVRIYRERPHRIFTGHVPGRAPGRHAARPDDLGAETDGPVGDGQAPADVAPGNEPGTQAPGHQPMTGPATPTAPTAPPTAAPTASTEGDASVTTETLQGPGSGELETTGDLRAETNTVLGLIEQAEVLAGLLRDWQTELPERYVSGQAAGGPSTRGLTDAVHAVEEAGGDAVALGEAVGQLRRACDQADALGEEASAMGAGGHTQGYVNA